ncbi:hypothetical protein GCM10007103_29720 [Salinimicrobium marinum]|uniref:Copper resistance protein D n=1 Tax=Salinimicrobium marinum TaxID=680283 RepID=A0A918W1E1_9FLAO|nr:hypothetical protein [Salinimicrobium marinum]GHA46733.1 hypothetical protein GCM10007103_29720 [Salinimicrobium marinum]
MMEYITVARVIHIVAIVLWIGGVSMVTTVIIPAVKRMRSKEEQIETFEKIEGKFSLQAKITTVLTGLSGFYMVEVMNSWGRFLDLTFWWMHAMVLVWFIFTIILFILEPFVLHKLFRKYAEKNPERTFDILHKAHWVLLMLSIITIIGALAGSHGLYFF